MDLPLSPASESVCPKEAPEPILKGRKIAEQMISVFFPMTGVIRQKVAQTSLEACESTATGDIQWL
jgi:hypothetical protein